MATARDKDGNQSEAAASVWVTRQGELWFGGEDHDRIDLLPEKKSYQPGETARLQVRMPFRQATALVSVEREGIIDMRVVQLNGQDPTVQLKIEEGWGPNVYVSVLALRGRLREVPWYSFFTWGFKAPREWWTAFWYEGKEYVAPTAMVDLSKPAYRLGLAELKVGAKVHRIEVKVTADKESYPVRGKAQVTIAATLPDGKPAANAEVAVAAVDQALLELMPNTSWNLLDAMLQRRAWGVETSTAQMEIIGRRHYGRKAVPAGGGGGRAQTRELLDTLLLWQPAVRLDANGRAQVTVPLNDALTTFRIVAVADAGTGRFGTGSTSIRATQDLQIISGLPPLVREDDQFRAQFTLRNTTKAAMKVEVAPRATLLTLDKQTVDIPAGESREVAWNVTAPAQLARTRAEAILWEIEARDTTPGAGGARRAQGHAAARAGRAADGAAGHPRAGGRQLRHRREAARRRHPRPRRAEDVRAAQARRGPAGRARLVRQLPVPLPGAEDQQGRGPARRQALAGRRGATAHLPGRRRPRQLLPAAGGQRQPRQRHAHRLPARGHARGLVPRPGLRAVARGARIDGARPDRFRRRPHPARLLEPAQGPGHAQARGDRSALALRQGHGPHALVHHRRAQPVAHAQRDRLAERAAPRARCAAARAAPGRGHADPQVTPVLPGHEAGVQHRAG